MDEDTLTTEELAQILSMNPHTLRDQLRKAPGFFKLRKFTIAQLEQHFPHWAAIVRLVRE